MDIILGQLKSKRINTSNILVTSILFHENTMGENNIGIANVVQCEGIFMEAPGADCLNNPVECYGSCCEWGDSSCDLVKEDLTAPVPSPDGASVPTRGTARPSSPSEDDGCNATCKMVDLAGEGSEEEDEYM